MSRVLTWRNTWFQVIKTLQVVSLIRQYKNKQHGTENNRSLLSTCSQVIRPRLLKIYVQVRISPAYELHNLLNKKWDPERIIVNPRKSQTWLFKVLNLSQISVQKEQKDFSMRPFSSFEKNFVLFPWFKNILLESRKHFSVSWGFCIPAVLLV